MSDDMEGREWRFVIGDMIECCEKAPRYTAGLDFAAFLEDSLTYDATLRNIELVGEAARHIPENVRAAHPNIPWRAIIGMRNRIAHAYLGIDNEVVWDVVLTDLPKLPAALKTLLAAGNRELGRNGTGGGSAPAARK